VLESYRNRFHLQWLWGQIKWTWLWYHLH
jgi:hypothetical protein